MSFMESWLPNIVTGVVSIGVTYVMAKKVISEGAKRSAKVTDSILRMLAEMNRSELVTNAKGEPTGGKIVTLAGGARGVARASADLTTGPASITGIGIAAVAKPAGP
jgi:hypothetical protein